MARGADEAAWNQTRALAEILWHSATTKPMPPQLCQPYLESKPLTPGENKANWDILMAGMEAMFKKRG
jgi:hypothetical protein